MKLDGVSREGRTDVCVATTTDQLEVCDADRTLVVHLLLVFVLNQALHQVPGVDLVVSHILGHTGMHTHTHTVKIIIIYMAQKEIKYKNRAKTYSPASPRSHYVNVLEKPWETREEKPERFCPDSRDRNIRNRCPATVNIRWINHSPSRDTKRVRM